MKKFKNCISLLVIFTSVLCSGTNVFAHSGRLDSSGGHNKRSDGTYHYHNGSDRTVEYSKPPTSSKSTITTKPKEKAPTPSPSLPNEIVKPTPAPVPTKKEVAKTVENPIRVLVDGKEIVFDQMPVIIEGRTMLPIRAIFEELKMEVNYESETKKVIAKNDSKVIIIELDNKIFQVSSDNSLTSFNEFEFDVLPINLDGRVLIPVRYVASALDYKVEWNEVDRIVTLDKK